MSSKDIHKNYKQETKKVNNLDGLWAYATIRHVPSNTNNLCVMQKFNKIVKVLEKWNIQDEFVNNKAKEHG